MLARRWARLRRGWWWRTSLALDALHDRGERVRIAVAKRLIHATLAAGEEE